MTPAVANSTSSNSERPSPQGSHCNRTMASVGRCSNSRTMPDRMSGDHHNSTLEVQPTAPTGPRGPRGPQEPLWRLPVRRPSKHQSPRPRDPSPRRCTLHRPRAAGGTATALTPAPAHRERHPPLPSWCTLLSDRTAATGGHDGHCKKLSHNSSWVSDRANMHKRKHSCDCMASHCIFPQGGRTAIADAGCWSRLSKTAGPLCTRGPLRACAV
jgi:hypothetical protein